MSTDALWYGLSFVTAFALVLFLRAYQTVGTDDVDEMKETDT